MRRPRIVLADDHGIVAEGLRSLIEPEFDIVKIVDDGRALVDAVDTLRPDLIIVDISMPLLNGIDAVRQIRRTNKEVKIVFLTMHSDVAYALSALAAGAQGYVLKHSAPHELGEAIRTSLRGKTYITPSLQRTLLETQKDHSKMRHKESCLLTKRQREVLQLLGEGYSVKEIASRLNISPRTVEFHKYQMMKDIGLKTVADLIRYAVKHGIVSP